MYIVESFLCGYLFFFFVLSQRDPMNKLERKAKKFQRNYKLLSVYIRMQNEMKKNSL